MIKTDKYLSEGVITFSGTKAEINSSMRILGTELGTQTVLPIKIIGEFKDIPPHLHQIFIDSMLRVYGKVGVHDNITEEPKKVEEKKSWYKLLISKLNK